MIVEQLHRSEAAQKEILIRSEYVEYNGSSADTRGDPNCCVCKSGMFIYLFIYFLFTKISFAVD